MAASSIAYSNGIAITISFPLLLLVGSTINMRLNNVVYLYIRCQNIVDGGLLQKMYGSVFDVSSAQ